MQYYIISIKTTFRGYPAFHFRPSIFNDTFRLDLHTVLLNTPQCECTHKCKSVNEIRSFCTQ